MASHPCYLLFAGVNGAGKSTLFQTGHWNQDGNIDVLPRINPDEIIVANGWDWRSEVDQIKAGKIAVRQIHEYLSNFQSFNQETTLTGQSIVRNIRKARDGHYHIVMFYICVSDPAIANARIAHRSKVGGHLIDEGVVMRRYDASLANLIHVVPLCDETYLYDNTINLELEARFKGDELAYYNPSAPHLPWLARVLKALGYSEVAL